MSNDKMREEFEAAYGPVPEGVSFAAVMQLYQIAPGGISMRQGIFCMQWCVWQDSRAAIEIELPNHDEGDCAFNCAIDLCIDAIESAGLKVKS